MSSTVKSILGILGSVWAAPLTLCGLIYVGVFALLGWYERLGKFGDALVWHVNVKKAPAWLNKDWILWGGHTVGQVVVLNVDVSTERGKVILTHEQQHVRQCMILGVFWAFLYMLSYLSIKLACPHLDPYDDNVFERDAYKGAGQIV